jgi:hypothetical protein
MCGGDRDSCKANCKQYYAKKIRRYKDKIAKYKKRRSVPVPPPPVPRPPPRPRPDPAVVTEIDEECVKQCTFQTMLCRKKYAKTIAECKKMKFVSLNVLEE